MTQKFYTGSMTRFRAAVAIVLFLSLTSPVLATDAPPPATSAPGPVAETAPASPAPVAPAVDPEAAAEAAPIPQKTDSDVTVMKDPYADKYIKGTPGNLSKLYWRLRVFDLGDDLAVDNFMMINECDLYQRYVNDDFEWKKLRDAARHMLKKERDAYPRKFIFILPVRLGRYDTEMGGFHLVDNTHFDNVRRMEITGNSLSRDICGKTGEIKDYPRNLMLILKEPMTYVSAKVDEHVAQAYIIRKQREILDLDYDTRQNRYNRIAYVRLRVQLDEYQGNVKGKNGAILAILHGRLEGVDLFEDPYGKMMLSMGEFIEAPPETGTPGISGVARSVGDGPITQDTGGRMPQLEQMPTPTQTVAPDGRTGRPVTPLAADAPLLAPHTPDAPTVGESIQNQPADTHIEIKQNVAPVTDGGAAAPSAVPPEAAPAQTGGMDDPPQDY